MCIIPPLFIEVPVPRQESERSCIHACVSWVSNLLLFLWFFYKTLELCWWCDIFNKGL